MATVFVVKNRAPHGRKPFFADEKADFTAIPKECALLLTKQYYTITPLPGSGQEGRFLFNRPERLLSE